MHFISQQFSLLKSRFIKYKCLIHNRTTPISLKNCTMLIYDISKPLVPVPVHCDSFKSNENSILKCSPKKRSVTVFYYSSFHILVILNFQINHKYAYCVYMVDTYVYICILYWAGRDMQRDTGMVWSVEEMKILFEIDTRWWNYCGV